MSTSDPTPEREAAKPAEPVVRYRPKLSQNQKKRSKLQQAPEEPAEASEPSAEPKPETSEKPTPPPVETPPSLRRNRLKRSGQMHDDLTKPLPEAGPDESESGY